MEKNLYDAVFGAIRDAVSASTTNVYFLYLPDEELLSEFTVVYELNERIIEDTFDSKEVIKTYDLQVKLNNSTSATIINNTQPIKDALYNLIDFSSIMDVRLINTDLFYDDELGVNTGYLKIEIDYQK
jgi:hypothetical protein